MTVEVEEYSIHLQGFIASVSDAQTSPRVVYLHKLSEGLDSTEPDN